MAGPDDTWRDAPLQLDADVATEALWRALWPVERIRQRDFFCFGMEVTLQLDLLVRDVFALFQKTLTAVSRHPQHFIPLEFLVHAVTGSQTISFWHGLIQKSAFFETEEILSFSGGCAQQTCLYGQLC